MNARRLIFVLLLAGFLAGGMFFLSRMAIETAPPPVANNAQPVQNAPSMDTVRILVAGVDLPSGSLIQANSLVFRDWPRSGVDEASYVVEGQNTIEEYQGAVVRTGFRMGEPVAKANMIKRNESGFLAAVLKPGTRAVTVNVNEGTGVAGFIFPGDKVDLILSHAVQLQHNDGQQRNHNVSETLLRDLRVIAVDQRASDQEQMPSVSRVVTFEVTSDQAERIALAQRMGEIRIVLRALPQEEATAEAGADGSVISAGVTGDDVDLATDDRTFTIDSDLSQIIASPAGDKDSSVPGSGGTMIQVIRGNATTDTQPK